MKRLIITGILLLHGSILFAHNYNHDSELFAQILLPVAVLGVLVCLPLTFLLLTSSFDGKINRLVFGAYSGAAFFFFGLLRLLYSYIHNHFELTCQVVGFGFYLSIGTALLYVTKLIVATIKERRHAQH